MSYLLETLGRGLLGQLLDAFENQLPASRDDDAATLLARRRASPRSADLALRLGLTYLRSLKLAEAQATFEAAMRLGPTPLKPALGLACVFDELGQIRNALESLNTAATCDPRDPAIAFAIGFCHERLHETDAAMESYQRAAGLCPQLRNAHERLAAIAVWRRDWSSAVATYETLAEIDPGDVDVLMTLASLYLQVGRPDDAIEQFQQALLIEPACFEGDAESSPTEEDELDEAIETACKLVEQYPGVADFRVRLGDLYVRSGEDEQAVAQYEAALDVQPGYLEATVKLGTQHLRQQRLVDAAQSFNRAVELNDRLMTAFAGLGVAQQSAGRGLEAGGTFDLAASLEPNSALLFSEATRLQLKSHQSRRRGSIERALGVAPRTSDDDLLGEALRRHRQALAQRPNHADLHYRHGLLLRQVGRFDEAVQAFRNAVTINPGYLKAMIKLAVCQREAGAIDDSIETFRRALTLRDGMVDVHYELALLFAQRNQFDLAVEQFEQTVTSPDRDPARRQNLALALQNVGMVDRATATWRSICELTRDADRDAASRGIALGD